ncbi:hypothetical protein FPV67DRAFT_1535645 [Lyophyllum atratum]|nr:hypothetical protein FPV67DRAFT_1535645 [Lyophyllum atratum]
MDGPQSQNNMCLEELPLELVDEIFGHASQGSLKNLCEVADWTRTLALPYLYSSPILKSHISTSRFLECLKRTPWSLYRPLDNDFQPRTTVCSLWIFPISQSIVPIFQVCSSLTNIALYVENFIWLVVTIPHLEGAQRKNISITIMEGNASGFSSFHHLQFQFSNSSLPGKVSHVRRTGFHGYRKQSSLTSLLPNLTHLMIPYDPSFDLADLNRIVEHPSLRVLIIIFFIQLLTEDDRKALDQWHKDILRDTAKLKVTIVESLAPDRLEEEWVEEARGGRSLWN